MDFRHINTLGLLGYIIVVNEEINSRQIQWLAHLLNKYNWNEYSEVIKDILDDKEDKIAYNICLDCLNQESQELKVLIYRSCFQLAIIDNDRKPQTVDINENRVLNDIKKYIDNINDVFQNSKAMKELDTQIYMENNMGDNFFNLNLKKILSVASSDYEDYKRIFDHIFDECNILRIRLESKIGIDFPSTLKTALQQFFNEYNNNVINVLIELKESSLKKEMASQSFSIALMGRTKAGKSTLHYIMCNEGKEFIGKGSQRTTRFNRVFSWNKIKIIDTPGIGAGEEEGRKDEKIALKVLSQADMICFVLIDDTIQNDILELLNKIAEYHKPMLIVLNHKEDIRKKSHLKSFMEKPNDWRLTTGESNLKGYINRLTRNAQKHNYDKLMKVVPVFLLATQIAKENNDSKMYDASNFREFIESVKSLIDENSLIYKSKTMLDEPSIRLHQAYDKLKVEERKLKTLQKKIRSIRENITESINSSKKTIKIEIESTIKTVYDDFFTAKSYIYVEENYSEKNIVTLNKNFNAILEEFGVKTKIKESLMKMHTKYQRKITSLLNEIDEELTYAKLNTDDLFDNGSASIRGAKGTFSFKDIFKVASMALDALSIVWPVLAVISIPVSFFGGFFKSKQKKLDAARALTLDNFTKLRDYSQTHVTKKTQDLLNELFKKDQGDILLFFDTLETQINDIIDVVSCCCTEFENGIMSIDKCLANRILQYLSNESRNFNIIDTHRDISKDLFMINIKKSNIQEDFNIQKYKKISKDNLRIRFIN